MNSFITEENQNAWFDINLPLYHCRFNKEAYSDNLFYLMGVHFPDSLAKAVMKRRAEFLAGRYCAAKSLAQQNIHTAIIGTGKNRNPLWPTGIHGSISHNNVYAVAITTNNPEHMGIGIDIESEIAADTIDSIQHQILSTDEIERLLDKSERKSITLALLFSLKESFFKAAYPTVERYFDFSAVSIDNIDWGKNLIHFTLMETLHPVLQQGMTFTGCFYCLPDNTVVTLVLIESNQSA